ncbi:hypothetical protein PV318_00515 [Streptomyces sp. ME02-6991-2B]|nr:hypothetical protein [Streptomyces sp. ME02-6991-2B]
MTQRQAYTNDLDEPRALVAITARFVEPSLGRAQPASGGARCRDHVVTISAAEADAVMLAATHGSDLL